MSPQLTARLVCLSGLFAALPAQADRFTTAIASEVWHDDTSPMHGLALVAWDTTPLWRGGRLHVLINTDTLSLGLDGVQINDRLEAGWELKSEFGIAGTLPDYFQDGTVNRGRGFYANYVQPRVFAKARIADRTWLEVEVGAQRWLFQTVDDGRRATDPALSLPPNLWIFQPRLRYTWWNLADDAGWHDRHRLFPRLRGVAAGLDLGLDARSSHRAWGAIDPDAFDPVDPRNAPDAFSPRVRQWFLAGWQVVPGARIQFREQAAAGAGEDDLTRDRLGGMGPYVVPLPGAPWAGWISEQYVSGMLSGHFKVADDLEVGPAVAAITLADPGRVGDDTEVATLVGVGALADWRIGSWQVDVRGGWSPSVSDRSDQLAYSIWVGGGYVFELD